ncbi:Vacuolar protein sorting-associated protein 35 family protein [Leishmania donovani]|uniref:Vacuolar protein sorting-associated protein 35 n=1 Tax=Leishmania donovani TaxID=5661 RepID=A0A504XN90_LEIDO|nr:Vacuolar protein sorting-associated protein 35 family protein [Leishmania donovani]
MAFRIPDDDGTDEYVVTLRGPVLTAAEEQKKWLQEALIAVDRKAAIMRSSMESQDSMAVVIRAAAQMLDELRTNLLEPQNYYELYMKVFSMMEVFVAYLEDEHRAKRHTLEEMYERVQFCGYIVPRLYLLIAAGAVYIDAGDQPALEIARDLVEMCKGVQHPTRGLFLRHFLLTMMKGKLPGDPNRRVSDVGNESAGEAQEEYPHKEDGGTVTDTANLLVQNFKEMNWLWIRMEAGSYTNRNGGSTNSVTACSPTTAALPATSPPPAASAAASSRSSDAATRPGSPPRSLRAARRTQQERRAMCVLVGMNVVRVAQLDGISRDVYASTILPQLLSIMVRYCEPLAQQYLFEVLIQVFPDEFHLFTIDKLFGAISRTVPGVEVSELFRSLMERLCKYAVAVQEGVTEVSSPEEEAKLRDVFPMLLNQMSCMSVSYSAQMSTTTVIKRTSTVPPPTPMMLGAYVTTMRHLVNVVMTLYGKSAKRRFMSLSNIVDVVASKFPSAVVDSSESKESTGVVETAAASAETSTPVSISPAAALAAGQFLVHIITECCATVQEVMAMEGIAALTSCLPFLQRREVAMAVCEVALRGSTAAPVLPSVSKAASSGAGGGVLKPTVVVTVPPPLPRPITALEDVARLFELLDPILVEQPDAPSDLRLIYKYNPAVEFVDEQNLVCRILHLLANDDPAVYAKMLTGVRKVLLQGGARRIPLTYPTLMTLHRRAALRLYAHKGILEVFAVEAPTEALKEYLFCSNTADVCEQSETSYALYVEALTLYEGHIEESHEQIDVLVACVNALCQMRNMPEENYEVLAAKVCQYASKMLKKHDQSYLVAVCAALFAKKQLSRENQQRVQECLRRSLKLAGQVLALAQLQLYVQLLNIFLHFFTSKSGYLVSVELVNELIEKISEASEVQRSEVGGDGKNSTADDDDSDNAANTFAKIRLVYRNITKYIRSRQSAEERWNEIDV